MGEVHGRNGLGMDGERDTGTTVNGLADGKGTWGTRTYKFRRKSEPHADKQHSGYKMWVLASLGSSHFREGTQPPDLLATEIQR